MKFKRLLLIFALFPTTAFFSAPFAATMDDVAGTRNARGVVSISVASVGSLHLARNFNARSLPLIR